MSVYKRYFRFTEGPVADEIDRLQDQRIAAGKLFQAVADKYGAASVNTWDGSGGFAGFTFKETPDQDVYRFLKKHRLWVPRKNVPAGKAMWAEINALPAPRPVTDALELVGLTANVPAMFDGGKWYAPVLWGFGKPTSVWFVSVPWKDTDPAEMDQYKLDRADGGRCDSNLEHLQWEAPANWTEVKHWQVEKEAEEINAAKKAEAAGLA